jgi:hypothetical protein
MLTFLYHPHERNEKLKREKALRESPELSMAPFIVFIFFLSGPEGVHVGALRKPLLGVRRLLAVLAIR